MDGYNNDGQLEDWAEQRFNGTIHGQPKFVPVSSMEPSTDSQSL